MNQTQLNILRKGVKEWNGWRKKYPHEIIDLSYVDLSESLLAGSKLWDESREGVNLSGINLSYANLTGADFEGANFSQADLSNSDLSDTNLWDTLFRGSKLTHANVTGANFTDADLGNSCIFGIVYNKRKMSNRYRGIKVNECNGHDSFKNDAQYQSYIDSIRKKLPAIIFWMWGFFTDYGRSLWRTLLVAFGWIVMFALIYYADFYYFHQLIYFNSESGFLTPLYFSVVTFSGFGDVLPKNSVGEILIMTEVMLGYMMLGLVLTVLTNNFYRHS